MKFEKDKFIWNQVIVNIAYMNAKEKEEVQVEIYLGLQQ